MKAIGADTLELLKQQANEAAKVVVDHAAKEAYDAAYTFDLTSWGS